MLIGAPDHWHVPMTIDALAAGKDVYVEKPLTHDLSEGEGDRGAEALTSASCRSACSSAACRTSRRRTRSCAPAGSARSTRSISPGTATPPRAARPKRQRRSDEVDWKASARPAPDQPFDDYRSASGAGSGTSAAALFTDLMVHWIDVAHWFLDLDHASGGGQHRRLVQRQGRLGDAGHGADAAALPGRDVQVYFEGTFSNARNGAMLEFMGSGGDALPRPRPLRDPSGAKTSRRRHSFALPRAL